MRPQHGFESRAAYTTLILHHNVFGHSIAPGEVQDEGYDAPTRNPNYQSPYLFIESDSDLVGRLEASEAQAADLQTTIESLTRDLGAIRDQFNLFRGQIEDRLVAKEETLTENNDQLWACAGRMIQRQYLTMAGLKYLSNKVGYQIGYGEAGSSAVGMKRKRMDDEDEGEE